MTVGDGTGTAPDFVAFSAAATAATTAATAKQPRVTQKILWHICREDHRNFFAGPLNTILKDVQQKNFGAAEFSAYFAATKKLLQQRAIEKFVQ